MERGDLAQGVEQLVEQQNPGHRAEVRELHLMTGGMSRETWGLRLGLSAPGGTPDELNLVLQLLPAGGLIESDLAGEFELLKALAGTSVPIADAYLLDSDGAVLGSPGLITGRVDGECDAFILSSDQQLGCRVSLARRFMDLLVSLVNADIAGLASNSSLKDPGVNAARVAVDHWTSKLNSLRLEANPEMALVHGWLQQQAPTTNRRVLVHGDFKPGNILVRNGEVAALLDWETAHLGSPLEDFGWVTNPVRNREHQIPGHWEVADMVLAFEAGTGMRVDRDELRWWNIFSCYKLAVIVLTGVHTYLAGDSPHLHHPPTWLYRAMFKMIREAQ